MTPAPENPPALPYRGLSIALTSADLAAIERGDCLYCHGNGFTLPFMMSGLTNPLPCPACSPDAIKQALAARTQPKPTP